MDYLKPYVLADFLKLEKEPSNNNISILNSRSINIPSGKLILVLSSNGQLKKYSFDIEIRNNNKDFLIDENNFNEVPYESELQKIQPTVLRDSIASRFPTSLNGISTPSLLKMSPSKRN